MTERRAAPTETSKARAAFEAYYALGPSRSLRKLANGSTSKLRQYAAWSSRFNWQERVKAREAEEVAAARAAARREAAALARRRMRNAEFLQQGGIIVIGKAQLGDLDEETARRLIGVAARMIAEGMRLERQEVEASTAQPALLPPRPVGQMTDEELADWVATLLRYGET